MKRIQYKLCFPVLLAFLAWGCIDEVMDKRDLDNISADDVWVTPSYVSNYVNYVMGEHLPKEEHQSFNNTDESYSMYDISVANDLFNAENENDKIDKWNYEGIRRINKFLDNVSKIPSDKVPQSTLERHLGQMKVLRAWLYFEMVRLYGGVPLILHEQRADEDLSVPRAKTSECIAAIVQDLNDAIGYEGFPMKWEGDDAGRISKAVAYALKGRVLLTYASPQFSSTVAAGTKSAEQRWQEAYTACKEAKEALSAGGYGLFRPEPATVDDVVTNYYDMLVRNEMNEEIVWARRYHATAYANNWDGSVRPRCTTGSGERPGPTLEIVNAFARADGTPYTDLVYPDITKGNNTSIMDAGETSTVAFWKDREPRFYAFIAYNGCVWPMRRIQQQLAGSDVSDGKMQHQWIFENTDIPYEDSYDTYGGGSGFRCRKMVGMDSDYTTGDETTKVAGNDYPLIRYAEVLLNFAEAAVKTGHESEALQVLRDIRKRAGIQEGNGNYGLQSSELSGNSLLAAIIHERRIELFFEGLRFHDLRRWRLYTDDLVPGAATVREGKKLNGTYRHTLKPALKPVSVNGVTLTPRNFELLNPLLSSLDINDADAYFEIFEHDIRAHDSSPFNFGERLYFLRIPYVKHITANQIIEQTQGWEDTRGPGTFNPYE